MTLWTGIVIGLGSCIATGHRAFMLNSMSIGELLDTDDMLQVVPELPDAGRDGNDFKSIHDAGAQNTDALSLTPVSSLHSSTSSREGEHDHAR